MKHTIAISLLLLAAAASASAEDGTFGFTDGVLDGMPAAVAYADLVGGSLEVDGDTVRVTIDLHVLPEMLPGVAYLFVFSNGTSDWYAGSATAPSLAFFYGTWISIDEGPGTMHDAKGSYSPGAPGHVTIEFPLSGLDDSVVLTQPRGIAAEIKGGAPGASELLPPFIDVDWAEGEGELWLPREEAPEAATTVETASADEPSEAAPAATEESAAPAPVPGFGASIALAAVAGAMLGATRRSR